MTSIDDVQDLAPRNQYVAAADQTEFDYTFPIFLDEDLVVDIDGEIQVLTTDYTVSGKGNDTGGTVTLIRAIGEELVGGEVVTIYRDIAIARDTDIQQNGKATDSDPEIITFAAVDDTAVLMWTGTEWITIKLSGASV